MLKLCCVMELWPSLIVVLDEVVGSVVFFFFFYYCVSHCSVLLFSLYTPSTHS